jgi:hypothetical protein
LRSHAGGPRARRHWTPHAGPEPSGSRAHSARGEEHSAMFPARRPARSINRSSRGEFATARSGAW